MKIQNGEQPIKRSESIDSSDATTKALSNQSSIKQSQDQQTILQQSPPQDQQHLFPSFKRVLLNNRLIIKSGQQQKRVSPIQNKRSNAEDSKLNSPQRGQLWNASQGGRRLESASTKRNSQSKNINLEENDFYKCIAIKQISPTKYETRLRQHSQSIQSSQQNSPNSQGKCITYCKNNKDVNRISLTQNINHFDEHESSPNSQPYKQRSNQTILSEIQQTTLNELGEKVSNTLQNTKINIFQINPSEIQSLSAATQKIFQFNFDSLSKCSEQTQASRRKFSQNRTSTFNESPEIIEESERVEGYYADLPSSCQDSIQLGSEQLITLGSTVHTNERFPISNSKVKDQILGTTTTTTILDNPTQQLTECLENVIQNDNETFDGISYYKERINRDANSKNKKIIISRLNVRSKTMERYNKSNNISEDAFEDKEYTDTNHRQTNQQQFNIQNTTIGRSTFLQPLRNKRIEVLNRRGNSLQENSSGYGQSYKFNQLKTYLEYTCEQIQEKHLNSSFHFDQSSIDFQQTNMSKLQQLNPNRSFNKDIDCYNFSSGSQSNNQQQNSIHMKTLHKKPFYSPTKKQNINSLSQSEENQKNRKISKGDDFLHISSIQSSISMNKDKNELSRQNIFKNPKNGQQLPQEQIQMPNYYDYNVGVNYDTHQTTINFYDSLQTPKSNTSKAKYLSERNNISFLNTTFSASPSTKLNPPPSYMLLKDFVQQRQKPDKIWNNKSINQQLKTTSKNSSDKIYPQKVLVTKNL